MGAGSTIGSIAGAALGTVIAPGIGTKMGAMIGGGIGQSIEGGIKSKKSDEGIANQVDPNRLRAFEEARRMQRQLDQGSDALTQSNIRENQQLTSATQRGIAQNTGGNINATVAGLLSAQKQGGINNAESLGVAAQRGQYFSGLAETIGNQIAQRKMDLQNLKSARMSAQGAQLQKQGFMNTFAGLAQTDPKTLTDMIAKFNLGNGQATSGTDATTAPTMGSSLVNTNMQYNNPTISNSMPTPAYTTEAVTPSLNTITF
jgi:hypothetical protein